MWINVQFFKTNHWLAAMGHDRATQCKACRHDHVPAIQTGGIAIDLSPVNRTGYKAGFTPLLSGQSMMAGLLRKQKA